MALLRAFAAMLVLSLLIGCSQSKEDKTEQDKVVFSLIMSHRGVSPEKLPGIGEHYQALVTQRRLYESIYRLVQKGYIKAEGAGYTVVEEVPFE